MNKKNQTIYLLGIIFLGLRAKSISLLSKIMMNRELGVEAMGLFSLINPLIVLLISLSSLSLPTVIATLVSKYPKKDKLILISSFSILIFLSISLMLIVFIFSDFIAIEIFKNKDVLNCILASLIMIPLTSISALIKGYFLGKGDIELTSSSQTYEEGGRLLYVMLILYFYRSASVPIKASFCVYSLAFGEVFQIGYMLFFSKLNRKNIIPSLKKNIPFFKEEIPSILKLCIPLTLSRLVGSFTYLLEPIIFTRAMLNSGYNSSYITIEYGILSSYVMPLLFLPSFISVALGNYLLPNMGKYIRKNEENKSIKLLVKIIILCGIIGLFISIFFYISGEILLNFLYGNNLGINYLKMLCFPFIIYYIETPIIIGLNVFELNKKTFISTLISCLFRIITLYPFVSYFGVIGISYSTILSVIIDISLNVIFLIIYIKRNNIKFID